MPSLNEAIIRPENGAHPEELSTIRSINEAAFGGTEEADLVDKLRVDGDVLASLVAEANGRLIGHILFSRMWIETVTGQLSAVALAPLAVLPEYQRQGVGQQLTMRGLDLLRENGEKIVVVVGHPDYYPRFGFSREIAQFIESPFPRDAFMILELSSGALENVSGKVVYPAAFGI